MAALSFAPRRLFATTKARTLVPDRKKHRPNWDVIPTGTVFPPKLTIAFQLKRDMVVVPEQHPFEKAYESYAFQLQKQRAKTFIPDFHAKDDDVKALQTEVQAEYDAMQSEMAARWASRITEADRRNDRKSIKRKLDRSLYFVVRPHNSDKWVYPEITPPPNNPKLHEVIHDYCGTFRGLSGFRYFFPGFHPATVINSQEKAVFVYKSIYLGGMPVISKGSIYADFLWLTKEEMKEVMDDFYYEGLVKVLRQ